MQYLFIQEKMRINDFKNTVKPLYNDLWLPHKNSDKRAFIAQWGSQYPKEDNTGILFVGKATYGWKKIKNHEDLFSTENQLFMHAEEQMQWILNSKRNKNIDKKYNSNKSAFWRLVESITKDLTTPNENWIKSIAWSNLYKVAATKGNPNEQLKKDQLQLCQQILDAEINFFSPKYIILLTSGWENYFLKSLNKGSMPVPITEFSWGKKKKYITRAYKIDNRIFITSHHPQGKPGKLHQQAICELIIEIESQ